MKLDGKEGQEDKDVSRGKDGLQGTITYIQSKQIYELTKEFTKKFLHIYRDSRLIDQMNSSGRSMKQNLAEGATRSSVKDYINFIGFSRASGEELLEDYKDLAIEWKIPISRPSLSVSSSIPSLSSSPSSVPSLSLPPDRAEAVNLMINLIARTNYLLDCQHRSLEKYFIEHGGNTENMAKKRREYRGY